MQPDNWSLIVIQVVHMYLKPPIFNSSAKSNRIIFLTVRKYHWFIKAFFLLPSIANNIWMLDINLDRNLSDNNLVLSLQLKKLINLPKGAQNRKPQKKLSSAFFVIDKTNKSLKLFCTRAIGLLLDAQINLNVKAYTISGHLSWRKEPYSNICTITFNPA